MATLDEIFAAMPDPAAEGTHELLVIDPDTRQIIVPDVEQILGVENDGKSETKYFSCPRYVGNGLDLAACFMRIVFQNANGDKDGYLITDQTVDGDLIYFSWELSEKVTQYQGAVQFLFFAADATDPARKWNTTLATGTSLVGLPTDGAAAEAATADVITQLLALVTSQTAAVEAAGAAQVENVQAEGAAQVAAVQAAADAAQAAAVDEIEAKGANTLATIPADYTALSTQVDVLTRSTAGAIVCDAAGEIIQATDSSDNYLPGLRIFGKTTQQTTTGAQLLNTTLSGATTVTGLTVTPTDDGNLLISGTHVTGAMWLEFGRATITAGKTYTLSCPAELAVHVWDLTNNKEYRTKKLDAESITIEADDTIDCAFVLNDAVLDKTYSNFAANVMFAEGAAALPWEPYTGGVASPCPAWPQELQSPAPVVTICGANIFDVSKMEAHANKTLEVTGDGATITATGGGDKPYTSSIVELDVDMLRGNTLIMTADSITNSIPAAKGGVQLNIHRTTKTDYEAINAETLTNALYIGDDVTELYIAVYTNNTATALDGDNIVTVQGLRLNLNKAEPWTKYTDLQTLTVANSLPGIPVASGGNYTDANGQQWICDEVDLARGVYVQRVGVKELDASADEYWYTINATGGVIFAHAFADALAAGSSKAVHCTHFAPSVNAAYNKTANACYFYDKTFRVCHLTAETLDDFKGWLAENPTTVIYPLATHVETPLSEAELAAFAALHSNKPTTTIINDAGAWMAAEYVADTKLYIDRKLAELVAAINP